MGAGGGGGGGGRGNRRHYFLLKLQNGVSRARAGKFAPVIVTTCHCNNALLPDAIYALTARLAHYHAAGYSPERSLFVASRYTFVGYERERGMAALSASARLFARQ